MPLKSAIAIALAAILTPFAASTAYAAPADRAAPSASHAHKPAASKHATVKLRPAAMKVALSGRRKHDTAPMAQKDTRPEPHAGMASISMAKSLDMPGAADAKKSEAGKKGSGATNASGKKMEGRRREARKAESRKSATKKDGAPAEEPTAEPSAAAPLPPLPDADVPSGRASKRDAKSRARARAQGACLRAPLAFVRGTEEDTFSLTTCDGAAAPGAVERLSTLVRPGGIARASALLAQVDPRLVERLGAVVDHFASARAGSATKVHVISGARPTSTGSYHANGRAIDFRVAGVSNEDVVAFCKTLNDTGCGYYPNSTFLHMDVRDAGTGHVAWIDASGPGESPRYVSAWPPPAEEEPHKTRDSREMIEDLLATLEKELPRVRKDERAGDAKDVDAPRAEMERDLP
jgi:uncharacterized protein YcbK (DUF882 family)